VMFTEEQEQGAAAVADTAMTTDLDEDIRVDLTHLKVFTIDGADTREVDDGVSVEQLGDGKWRVWAHVADPTSVLHDSHLLVDSARTRGTSMYLPYTTVPMFPWTLAAGPMSLLPGRVNRAMSFGLDLDESGVPTGEVVMCASKVNVTYALTYEQADDLMALHAESEPELSQLSQLTDQLLAWRKEHGASAFNLPESQLAVRDHDTSEPQLEVERISWNSPSRLLVSECMIAAGAVAGSIGAESGLVLPYRGQKEPQFPSDEELASVPEGYPRMVAMRGYMTAGTTSLVPSPHAGLGMEAYVQVTSPIRRFADLVAHIQLKAHLHDRPPALDSNTLQFDLEHAGAGVREVVKAQRASEKYWLMQYFLQQESDAVYSGLVVKWIKESARLGLVLLDGLDREMVAKLTPSAQLGHHVFLQCAGVMPSKGNVKLSQINTQSKL